MEVGLQRHALAASPSGIIRYTLYRRLSGLQDRSGRMRKISPPTGIRFPDRQALSKSLFIHLVICLTTGPKPLPKRALHIVRSRASSFKWEYPLLSLRSSNSFSRLLPRLPVTSIHSFISLSYDRSKASSKASSPHSAIQSFLFQMRVSSPFLTVIQ
jgi:hypothetical protein